MPPLQFLVWNSPGLTRRSSSESISLQSSRGDSPGQVASFHPHLRGTSGTGRYSNRNPIYRQLHKVNTPPEIPDDKTFLWLISPRPRFTGVLWEGNPAQLESVLALGLCQRGLCAPCVACLCRKGFLPGKSQRKLACGVHS